MTSSCFDLQLDTKLVNLGKLQIVLCENLNWVSKAVKSCFIFNSKNIIYFPQNFIFLNSKARTQIQLKAENMVKRWI